MKTGHDDTLARIAQAIEERKSGDADASYVASLFAKGEDAILKKIGEEATEVVMAAKDADHGGDRRQIVNDRHDVGERCQRAACPERSRRRGAARRGRTRGGRPPVRLVPVR